MTFGVCMMKLSEEKKIEYMSVPERHGLIGILDDDDDG
jgi:hypothetical protein